MKRVQQLLWRIALICSLLTILLPALANNVNAQANDAQTNDEETAIVWARFPATIYTEQGNPVSVERIWVRAPAYRDEAGAAVGTSAVSFSVLRLPGHAGATTPPIYLLPDWNAQGLVMDSMVEELLPLAARFGPDADIYMVEPRGLVGPDADFTCPGVPTASLGRAVDRGEVARLTAAFLAECRLWWEDAGVDTGAYTLEAMASDVVDVARILEHEEIQAVGVGLGAFVALHVAQRADSPLERAILLRPPGIEYPLVIASGLDELMGTLGHRSAIAPTLFGLVPDLDGLLTRISARLTVAPVAVTVTNPATQRAEVVAVGVDDLHMVLGATLAAGDADAVPALLYEMVQGDFRFLAEQTLALRRNLGYNLAAVAALCRAGPDMTTLIDLDAAAAVAALGRGPFQMIGDVCAPFADLAPSAGPVNFNAIESPVLFVTGDLDGRVSALEINTVATRHLVVDDLFLENWTGRLDAEFWRVSGPVMLNFLANDYEAIPLLATALQFDPIIARPFQMPPWQAEYYANRNLTGDAVVNRVDDTIDFNWELDAPAPGLANDDFSARWSQQVELPSGVYRFYVWSDDGARLWVDNVLVLDAWQEGPLRVYVVDVNLVQGIHDIRYEYFDSSGQAFARLRVAYVTAYDDWLAEYYPNTELVGTPIVMRNEQAPNAFWGATPPAPGVPAGNFSARWRTQQILEPGAYTFRMTANGGTRLYVDNVLVIDAWENVGRRILEANHMVEGIRPTQLRVEYFALGGAAELTLRWLRQPSPVGPEIALQGPARAAVGTPLQLSLTATPEAGRSLQAVLWDMGDNTQYTTAEISHAYAAPGIYDVTVVVTDSGGIAAGVSRQVRVDPQVAEPETLRAPLPSLIGPAIIEAGAVIRFDAGASLGLNPIVRFAWTFGDGTRSEAAWVEKVYQTAGVYNVRLRVVDDQGLTATRNQVVLVLPPTTAVAETLVLAEMPSLAFEAPAGPVVVGPDTQVSTGLEAILMGSIGEQSILFDVNEEGALVVNLPANTSIVLDARPSLPAQDSTIIGYLWDVADGFSTATDEVIELVFSAPGQYRVRLTVSDSLGDTSSRLLILNVVE